MPKFSLPAGDNKMCAMISRIILSSAQDNFPRFRNVFRRSEVTIFSSTSAAVIEHRLLALGQLSAAVLPSCKSALGTTFSRGVHEYLDAPITGIGKITQARVHINEVAVKDLFRPARDIVEEELSWLMPCTATITSCAMRSSVTY